MADSTPAALNSQTPREFYQSFAGSSRLKGRFHDIDEEIHFQTYLRLLQNVETQNFVLDFGSDDAWCALNLEEKDIALLLHRPKPRCFGTRWINIWNPEEQKDMIRTVMNHYGVSERLRGMMCTEPVKRTTNTPSKTSPRGDSRSTGPELTQDIPMDDLEGAYAAKDPGSPEKVASLRNLTFAQVTNQIWHFCSVDHGLRYTCIGYNSLYVIPNHDNSNGKALPDGLRLWSWLVLFDDDTIVSIQDNPFARLQGPLSDAKVKPVLGVVRRNVHFIFSGVSKQQASSPGRGALGTIRVRNFSDSGSEQESIKQEDGPSLLLYYLFDDWALSYGLIAKREHKYGVWLDELRENMLSRPVVDLVHELHWLGRQLAVLKRVYQSYELIMTRLLQRQRLLRDEERSSNCHLSMGNVLGDPEFAELRQSTTQSGLEMSNTHDSVGVPLSQTAVARFERLLDRIKLYCLSEIDSCMSEKESLTFLNFNLIALKDTQAIEKLTRITLLLAKVTMLFLPVNLMTAYFSTNIRGIQDGYSLTQYWGSFAVIMFLSILLLALFGYASDTVEGRPIYRSMVRTILQSSRHRIWRKQHD